MTANGTRVRTVAIEDEDPERVMAAVRAMELDRFPNTSYPRGLRRLIGRPGGGTRSMTRQAVIDVGTNSVKFHVADRRPDGTWAPVMDRAEVTRLGEGIRETGEIAPDAIERRQRRSRSMAAEAARLGADGVTAVGTMGLRTATNSQAFLDLVKERCGVAIEVISGQDESRDRLPGGAVGGSAWPMPTWSSSTPAAGAPSSPSATGLASIASSASTSAPCG